MKASQVEQFRVHRPPHRTSAASGDSGDCFERVPALEINDGLLI